VTSVIYLIEPPYTEPYVRWCERTGASHLLLLDYRQKRTGTCQEFLFSTDAGNRLFAIQNTCLRSKYQN